MTAVLIAAGLLLLVGLAGLLLLRADAARLANSLRLAGPIAVGILGGGSDSRRPGWRGRHGAFGCAGLVRLVPGAPFSRASRPARGPRCAPQPSRWSSITTAAICRVASWQVPSKAAILRNSIFPTFSIWPRKLSSDEESLRLLETYLDGRFPVWRDHVETETGQGQGSPASSGGMTKEEAYEILGLEAGASPADIRKAHRRLMQRLHPDVGGSSFFRGPHQRGQGRAAVRSTITLLRLTYLPGGSGGGSKLRREAIHSFLFQRVARIPGLGRSTGSRRNGPVHSSCQLRVKGSVKPEALPRMPPASSATRVRKACASCSLPSEPTCTAQPPAGAMGIRRHRVDTGIAGHRGAFIAGWVPDRHWRRETAGGRRGIRPSACSGSRPPSAGRCTGTAAAVTGGEAMTTG